METPVCVCQKLEGKNVWIMCVFASPHLHVIRVLERYGIPSFDEEQKKNVIKKQNSNRISFTYESPYKFEYNRAQSGSCVSFVIFLCIYSRLLFPVALQIAHTFTLLNRTERLFI